MQESKRPRLSLSTQVFIGLGLGILSGLFFGELVGFLKVVGDAFIGLLQMVVLPYVILSLIAGLGRLTIREAISIAKKSGAVLLILWFMVLIVVIAIPLAFPKWKTASYFSSSLVETGQPFNFLELFIPANPFYSLANNVVPAVVLFSIFVGIALMGVKKKEVLIENLNILIDAMMKVTQFVVKLAPIGIFAITASAAGTMNVEEFGRWQVYLLSYVTAWAVMSFWMLPVLVTSLTPLKYKDVIFYTRDALVTAFATGNLLIVLPMLASKSKELLRKYAPDAEEGETAVDVIVPTFFTFPDTGKLLTLSFVLFAGWFSGFPVSPANYPAFATAGLLSFFGFVAAAMPFLLDLLHIPADTFQLFLVSDVLISRFGTPLAALHILVLALVGSFALIGRITVRWKKLLQFVALSIVLLVVSMGAVRLFFTHAFEPAYTKYKTFVETDLFYEPVKTSVYKESFPPPMRHEPGKSRLDIIQERGTLRVGYTKDSLPLMFTNAAGRLVGFDADMAHLLARIYGVKLDFVLIKRKDIGQMLNRGYCDIVMSGVAVTPNKARQVSFSEPYLNSTLAFVLEDHLRDEFASWRKIREIDNLRIGIPDVPYFVSFIQKRLPRAEIIPLRSVRDFFKKGGDRLDALAFSAEAGAAWTLIYPAYAVAVPQPDPIKIPTAYAMPLGDRQMVDFMNTWIELKKSDNTLKELYDHWILGKSPAKHQPRWSVIQNVLHWVD